MSHGVCVSTYKQHNKCQKLYHNTISKKTKIKIEYKKLLTIIAYWES